MVSFPRLSRYVGTPIFQLRDGAGGLTNSTVLGVWERPIDFTDYQFDTYHIVSRDEVGRLDIISYEHYNTPHLWWAIADANGINNFLDDMDAGIELGIPRYEDIQQALTGETGNTVKDNYPNREV